MIDNSFSKRFLDKYEELLTVWRGLSIERNINDGELIESFYQERFQDLSRIKSDAWIVVNDMIEIVKEMDEFRIKIEKMQANPQTDELWKTIELAIELVK